MAQSRNHQSRANWNELAYSAFCHYRGCFLFYSSFMSTHNNSTKAIFYALGANAGIAIAKFSAALFTGSGAMLAEAIHSLADCANQIFLLRGLREANKPADASHPMGYGRVEKKKTKKEAQQQCFLGGAVSVMEGIKHFQ